MRKHASEMNCNSQHGPQVGRHLEPQWRPIVPILAPFGPVGPNGALVGPPSRANPPGRPNICSYANTRKTRDKHTSKAIHNEDPRQTYKQRNTNMVTPAHKTKGPRGPTGPKWNNSKKKMICNGLLLRKWNYIENQRSRWCQAFVKVYGVKVCQALQNHIVSLLFWRRLEFLDMSSYCQVLSSSVKLFVHARMS
jgi:hypothetical protein